MVLDFFSDFFLVVFIFLTLFLPGGSGVLDVFTFLLSLILLLLLLSVDDDDDDDDDGDDDDDDDKAWWFGDVALLEIPARLHQTYPTG